MLAERDMFKQLNTVAWSRLPLTQALETAVALLGRASVPCLGLLHPRRESRVTIKSQTGSQAELDSKDEFIAQLRTLAAAAEPGPLRISRSEARWPAAATDATLAAWLQQAEALVILNVCQDDLRWALLIIDSSGPAEQTAPGLLLGELLCSQLQTIAARDRADDEANRLSAEQRQTYDRLMTLFMQTSATRPLNLVVHQVNNFLTPILGYAQLLAEGGLDAVSTQSYAKRIFKEADQLHQVIDNMMRVAKRRNAERQPMSLNDLLRETVQFHAYDLKKANVTIHLELDPTLPPAYINPFRLQGVFSNLLKNALQAITSYKGQGTITIRTWRVEEPEERLGFGFSDDGPGIPPELCSRIFEPFYTTMPPPALGLGLTVCQNMLAEEGGQISVQSVLGQGSTFAIELPALSAAPRGQ